VCDFAPEGAADVPASTDNDAFPLSGIAFAIPRRGSIARA
jgi:hypothetical protein